MNFNELSHSIHVGNVEAGWWDADRCVFECLQLISTEVAEATDGERRGLMDDHLPHREMGEVELADVLIRTLDLMGKLELVYPGNYRPHSLLGRPDLSIAGMHLAINMCICELAHLMELNTRPCPQASKASKIIATTMKVAEICGYDIEGAMHEKLEYNKTRADHKRENRKAAGGKKF